MKKLIISILIFLAFGGMDFAFAKFYNPLFRPFITAINTYDRWVCPEGEGRGEMDGTHPSDCYDGITDLNSTLLKPGSTLYAHGYFSGEYKSAWAQSGSLGKPITITAYDKANPPTFDGIYELVGWTESGTISEMWYHSSASSPYVMLQERGGIFTVLEEVGESGGTCEYVWGATRDWCYDPSEDRIYVMATDGTYDTEKFHRFRLEWANFSTDTSYISVRNVIVKNYTRGFYLNNNNSSTVALGTFEVDSVTFERVRVGIAYVPDNGLDGGNLKFNNNTFDYVGHSILMTPSYVGPSQISEVEVINNTIENAGLSNSTAQTLSGTVTDEWLMGTRVTFAASGFSDAEQITLGNVSDAIISHNVIGPGKARGIVMDCQYGMDVKDIIIEYNVIKGLTYTGMITFGNSDQLGDEYEGIIIRRNQLIDNGLGIDGSDVGWYSDAQRGAMRLATTTPFSAANYVVNNSFYGNYRDIRIEHSSDYIVFKNNILQNDGDPVGYNGAYVFVVTDPTDEGIDYNLYYPITGCPAGECWYLLDGYYNWATWSGTYDTNSPTSADPKYVNPATYDLNLQAESPALNAGIVIAGIIDDYCGSAPDLGYIEASCPTNIYVDKANEGGTEDGSIGNPWGTIAEGLTDINAKGTGAHTLHIVGGQTYFEQDSSVTVSGLDDSSRVVIQPKVGTGHVTIDGSGGTATGFEITGDYTTIKSITSQNFIIQNFTGTNDYAVKVNNGDYAIVDGITATTGMLSRGIAVVNAENVIVQNNIVTCLYKGLYLLDDATLPDTLDGNTFQNNQITVGTTGAGQSIFVFQAYPNTAAQFFTNTTITGNTLIANITGYTMTADFIGIHDFRVGTEDLTITNNIVYVEGTVQSENGSSGILLIDVDGGVIGGNTVYNWGEYGIDVGGTSIESQDIIVEDNIVYNNGRGNISVNGDTVGATTAITVRNNLSYLSIAPPFGNDYNGGFDFHANDPSTASVYWYNNTHWTDQTHAYAAAFWTGSALNAGDFLIKNNIFISPTSTYVVKIQDAAPNMVFDYNIAFNTGAGNAVIFNSSPYANDEMLTGGTSLCDDLTQMCNAQESDPSLISPPGNMSINAGSSAYDNGVTIGTFSDDILGVSRPQASAWDIGAYEF